MAISFPHSTRVLRNDGFMPIAFILFGASFILLLWGLWFVFARIPLTVDCPQAEVGQEGAILAQCPADQLGRVRQGAPALAIVTSNGTRRAYNAVVLRVPNSYSRGLAADQVEVYPFLNTDLPAGAQIEVRIEVQELSPLQLVLQSRRGG